MQMQMQVASGREVFGRKWYLRRLAGVSPMAYCVPSPGLVWDGCNVEERPRCRESAEMVHAACLVFVNAGVGLRGSGAVGDGNSAA